MDNCIDKFLVNYKQGSIEKHSDSSDFDEAQVNPPLSPKGGKHSLFNTENDPASKAKRKVCPITCRSSEKKNMHPNVTIYDNIPERDHDVTNTKLKRIYKNDSTASHSRGDNISKHQISNQSKIIQPKPIQCFSSILRRSYNSTKQSSSIKDIPQDNLNNGKTSCPDCERRRIKKLNRCRQSYVVQPVYVVDNIQGGPVPFGHANDQAPLSQHIHKATRKQDSNTSYELTSSESDIGNKNQRKHVNRRRNFIERFQKEMRKEYIKYEKELIRNRVQQYPSKRDNNPPYQVFSTPYCQVINASINRDSQQSNIPSTSSGFWEYLFEKIRGKCQTDKDDAGKSCYCTEEGRGPSPSSPQQPIQRCSPGTCVNYGGKLGDTLNKLKDYIPNCKSCIQQTEDANMDSSSNNYPTKNGPQNARNGPQVVKCKCYSNKKRKQTNRQADALKSHKSGSQKSLTQSGDVSKPCQEPHDDVTRTVEEKYNGEILCIHNPPCILINGCLNLPPTERPLVQGNLWPVTQDKKSSFYHICRKKRPKYNEQASQYHPPSVEVHQMQIKTEKLVQSICNHDPPCEIVYGCYKPKYDPKLDNSCVHVPMCERLPQCLIEDRRDGETQPKQDTKSKLCEHKPKCNELPLCSRKFVVLTAKGTVGTQVRPKNKLVCRHEPPCIMIPKCLARIIADNYVPYEAIPDCVHQPCCDMIPACCRKAAKEMDKLPSLEDGISLKLPRAPVSHRNKILQAIRRTKKPNIIRN